MSDAIETQGFELEIGNNASPPVYTEVKEIKSFTAFDGSAAEIDVTHLKSTAKEFRMGLQDFGTASFDINYLPEDPGQMAARAAKASRALTPFRMTFSDGSTAEFSGYVTNSPRSGGVDNVVESSINIRISGDVVEN